MTPADDFGRRLTPGDGGVTRGQFLSQGGRVALAGLGLGGASSLLAACGGSDAKQASANDLKGVTVRLVSLSGGPIGDASVAAAKDWERRTGAKVELVGFPFGDIFSKIRSSLLAGEYLGDLYHIAALWGGDLMGGGAVEKVPDDIKGKLDLPDILPAFRQYLSWDGSLYGVPLDGDSTFLDYRTDLFDDPGNQARFKRQLGYDLPAPPTTWAEFMEVSKFFADQGTVSGESVPMAQGVAFWIFMIRAAAYAKVPGIDAFLFNPASMRPLIDTPGFVRALTEWKQELAFGNKGMINQDQGDSRAVFSAGKAAMTYEWADVGTLSVDPKTSAVKGKVGFGLTPGSKDVYDWRSSSWRRNGPVSHAPYLAFGGWIQVVPKNSKQKAAAFSLAAHLGTNPVQTNLCITPGTGVNPSRKSTLENDAAWEKAGFDKATATSYLDVITKSIDNANTVIDLRIPGQADYQDALEVQLQRALAGQASPQSALTSAAKAWEGITDKLGRDKQKSLYGASLSA